MLVYHDPVDRPSLEELLNEAIVFTENEDFGETDEQIREWVQRWIFDADPSISQPPPPPPPPQPPRRVPPAATTAPAPASTSTSAPPPGGPPGTGPSGAPKSGAGVRPRKRRAKRVKAKTASAPEEGLTLGTPISDGRPRNATLIADFNTNFPHGARTIYNQPSRDLLCGVRALADSLRAQLGPNPVVNGVSHPVNLPTPVELVNIHTDLVNQGAFAVVGGAGAEVQNVAADVLAAIMGEWARRNGIG
jgi:hypothetical protein